jgi:hypothetical protein
MEDSISISMCPSWSSSDEAVVDTTTTSTAIDTKSSSLDHGSTTTKSSTLTRPLEEEPPSQLQLQPQSMIPNKNMNKNKKQRRSSSNSKTLPPKIKIYCDLDGVLVDFNRGVMELTGGQHPDRMSVKKMWAAVSRKPDFFQQLPWTRDGKRLWHAIQQLQPDILILTGVPSNRPHIIGQQKATWCQRELGIDVHHVDMAGMDKRKQNAHIRVVGTSIGTNANTRTPSHDNHNHNRNRTNINVISCWSKFKYKECKNPGDILIDDRQKFQQDWEAAGGIFVHHEKTEKTLLKLRELMNLGEEADYDNDDELLQGDDNNNKISEANNNPREKQRSIQRPPPKGFLQDERPETP